MRITGGFPVGGNLNYMAANNPLLDPRFKIQGGEPWNPTPLLPGKHTKEFEQREFKLPSQPRLPAAGVGNVGGMLAQATPSTQIPAGFAGKYIT